MGVVVDIDVGDGGAVALAVREQRLQLGPPPADCPGRKPAFLVFKRPARPYKSPVQNGFS
jgi:hypothetical protein